MPHLSRSYAELAVCSRSSRSLFDVGTGRRSAECQVLRDLGADSMFGLSIEEERRRIPVFVVCYWGGQQTVHDDFLGHTHISRACCAAASFPVLKARCARTNWSLGPSSGILANEADIAANSQAGDSSLNEIGVHVGHNEMTRTMMFRICLMLTEPDPCLVMKPITIIVCFHVQYCAF